MRERTKKKLQMINSLSTTGIDNKKKRVSISCKGKKRSDSDIEFFLCEESVLLLDEKRERGVYNIIEQLCGWKLLVF